MSRALAEAMRIVKDGTPRDCLSDSFLALVAASGEIEQAKICQELGCRFKTDFGKRVWTKLVNDVRQKSREYEPTPQRAEWERGLLRKPSKDGIPGPVLLCEHNASMYFENDSEWDGVLGYNEFTAQHAVLKTPPDPLTVPAGGHLQDNHDTQFARWLQIRTNMAWNVDMVRRVTDDYARRNSFHPPRDYLDGLKWDGKKRLATWLFDYAGAGPADASEVVDEKLMAFYAAAGERWMISAVARLRDPGCQVDHMIVLEGGEGLGKSTLVNIIGRGWSGTMSREMDGKSAQEIVASDVWIFELPELATLKGAREVEAAKAFLTNREDIFRPPYGRRVIRYKRQCAFLATVNGDQYLDSAAWEDGKRRVWPIRCCRPFDLSGLELSIDQLWAEADSLYRSGARWHFDRDEDSALIETAKQEQLARVPDNVMSGGFINAAIWVAGNSMENPGSVSVEDVCEHMKISHRERRGLGGEVTKALKNAGWASYQANGGRRYRRP